MITKSKQIIPAYLYTEDGVRCFLNLNADIHGKWSVGYIFFGEELGGGQLSGAPAEFPAINNCESPDEALEKMAKALKEQK